MNKILEFDNMVRKIISVLYRIVLIFYGTSIVLSIENYFPWSVYVIAFLLYVILSYYLIRNKSAYIKIRLLLDYSLIFLILFNKPIDSLVYGVFLLIPIFNTPNFSGQKRSYFMLYSIPIMSYFFLTRHSLHLIFLVPFLSLFCISYLEYIRSKSFNFYYALTNSISEFYDARMQTGRDYKIYNTIIKKFNTNKFSSVCIVEAIFCLRFKGESFFIQNSSTLSFDVEIEDLSDFLSKVKLNEVFSDSKIKVDEKKLNFNLAIPVKREEEYEVYIITGVVSKNLINVFAYIRDKYFLTPFLIPFFVQLSRFFAIEYRFRKNKVKNFQKIRGEYEYVLRTINAVHFIRNRLTPFKNYLEMTSDLYRPNVYLPEVKTQLENIIIEEELIDE